MRNQRKPETKFHGFQQCIFIRVIKDTNSISVFYAKRGLLYIKLISDAEMKIVI